MEEGNKRIATNTLFLYFRLIFKLFISLITSRIILDALGFSDFGLYNVVGGTVTMFAFLNNSMSAATQRFLNFEMGKKGNSQVRTVFSTSLYLHLLIALVVLILAETIALWFLNNKLQIPPERVGAANWVLQFSIFTLIARIITIPYQAAIIAHERMATFAYISIFEAVSTLLIVLGIKQSAHDRLILYALSLFILALCVSGMYAYYSIKKFRECRTGISYNRSYFREMLGYSGWNTLSVFSQMLKQEGVDILLNLFFGTVVNAARALAVRINSVVNGFVQNFMQAMNPQIVKNYAKGELKEMEKLIMFGSKFSFFLILFFALPILIETDTILLLWLKDVPEYTTIFTRLVLLTALVDSLNNSLWISQSATGKIKKYHITLSSIGLMNLPISYLLLRLGFPPYIPFAITLFQSFIMTFIRLGFLKNSIQLNVPEFLKNVLFRALLMGIVATAVPLALHLYLPNNLLNVAIVCITASSMSVAAFFFIGLKTHERSKVLELFASKIPLLKRFI